MKECSCYHIIVEDNKVDKFEGSVQSTSNFHEYAQKILKSLSDEDKLQEYQFDDNSTVKQTYLNYLDDQNTNNWNQFHAELANNLLLLQSEAQKKVAHLERIVTPGSLLAIHEKQENGEDLLVLIKIEHNKVADSKNFEEMFGLPLQKPALKAAVIHYDKDKIFSVFISNIPFSRYWVNLLQASPVRENKVNTLNAIEAVEHTLKVSLKTKHKADYLSLRNSMLTYFRSNEGDTIDYNDFVGTVFDSYTPYDDSLKIPVLTQKLLTLPNNKNATFERQFMIDMANCKKRLFKTSIALSDDIDLTLKKEITDLEDNIEAYEKDGRQGIIIYSEDGYQYFKKKG